MYRFPYTYDRLHYYQPYRRCYGYHCVPYANFMNSNYATTRQDIYNSGIMTDVVQQAVVNQSIDNNIVGPLIPSF